MTCPFLRERHSNDRTPLNAPDEDQAVSDHTKGYCPVRVRDTSAAVLRHPVFRFQSRPSMKRQSTPLGGELWRSARQGTPSNIGYTGISTCD